MIALTHETRMFLKTGITDLWLSFEGLRGIVVNTIRQEPTSGFVFVFCNRANNRVKCLYWDGGTLGWPKDETGAQQINGMQLRLLLEGFELKSRRGWYRRGAAPKGLEEVRPG